VNPLGVRERLLGLLEQILTSGQQINQILHPRLFVFTRLGHPDNLVLPLEPVSKP
jgi:hypothetical protein